MPSALDRTLSDGAISGELRSPRPRTFLRRSRPMRNLPAAAARARRTRRSRRCTERRPGIVSSQRLACVLSRHICRLVDDDGSVGRARKRRAAGAAIAEMLPSLAAVHAAHDDPSGRSTSSASRSGAGSRIRRSRSNRSIERRPAARRSGGPLRRVRRHDHRRPRRQRLAGAAAAQHLLPAGSCSRRSAGRRRRIGAPPPTRAFSISLGSAERSVSLCTFTLDDEALVSRSMQLDEFRGRGCRPSRASRSRTRACSPTRRCRSNRSRSSRSRATARVGEMRTRATTARREFHGTVSGIAARAWSVSAIETYLDCPFKFFAQHVLKLEEEPDDEEVMDPRRQGQFVHEVFERFFDAWQDAGHRAITPDESRRRARAVHRSRRSRARAAAERRGRARADAAARFARRRRPRRSGASHGGRAADRRRRAAARATARRRASRLRPPTARARSR